MTFARHGFLLRIFHEAAQRGLRIQVISVMLITVMASSCALSTRLPRQGLKIQDSGFRVKDSSLRLRIQALG